MIRAYRKIEESDASVTYEYNTVCSYWLYATVIVMGIGYGFEINPVFYLGVAVLALYVAIVYFPALNDARKIKAAIRDSEGTISGSRWSFSKPLRVKVDRKRTTE